MQLYDPERFGARVIKVMLQQMDKQDRRNKRIDMALDIFFGAVNFVIVALAFVFLFIIVSLIRLAFVG